MLGRYVEISAPQGEIKNAKAFEEKGESAIDRQLVTDLYFGHYDARLSMNGEPFSFSFVYIEGRFVCRMPS